MNPDTGIFYSDEELKQQMQALTTQDALVKARLLGWMEIHVGAIVRLQGHDFRVLEVGRDTVLLQSVKVIPHEDVGMVDGTRFTPPGDGKGGA